MQIKYGMLLLMMVLLSGGVYAEDFPYGIPAPITITEHLTPLSQQSWSLPLYPIGWSRDGKFAYVTCSEDDMAGGPFFVWTVQDMVSDKIIWVSGTIGELMEAEHSISDADAAEIEQIVASLRQTYGEIAPRHLAFLVDIRRNGSRYAEQLGAYGIEPGQKPVPGKFPFTFEGSVFSAGIANIRKAAEQLTELPTIIEFDVMVTRESGSSKTIMRYRDESSGPSDVQAPLYFRSPFQPRIAVLVARMGPPFHGDFSYRAGFAGCNMKVGF